MKIRALFAIAIVLAATISFVSGPSLVLELGHTLNNPWQPDKYTSENPCLAMRNARPVQDTEFLASFQAMKTKMLVKKAVAVCQAPILGRRDAVGEYSPDYSVMFFTDEFVGGELMYEHKGGLSPFKNASSVTMIYDATDKSGVRSFVIGHEFAHCILEHRSTNEEAIKQNEDEADALVLAILGDRAFRNTECVVKRQGSFCFDDWDESPEIEGRLGRLHAIARKNHWESPYSAYPQASD